MSEGVGSNRYAVLGVGCIGSAAGILLAAKRYDVNFVGRSSERFLALKAKGVLQLILPEEGADPVIAENALITDDASIGLEGRNTILIGTKRVTNAAVADVVAKHAARNALVVMLQNGLNAAEDFSVLLNKAGRTDLIVLDSVVQFNVVQRDTGIFHWTTPRVISCVAVDGSKHASIAEERVCAALRASGLDSYAETRFKEVAAGKLLLNLGNALNALAGCEFDSLMLEPGYRMVYRETIREAKAVFKALKIDEQRSPRDKTNFAIKNLDKVLGAPTIVLRLILAFAKSKGGKSSMLQDLESRAPETEIDYLTGWIVKKGEELKVSTPVSTNLVRLVKQATVKREGSPHMTPDALAEAVGLSTQEPSGCGVM